MIPHISKAMKKGIEAGAILSRLMPNVNGPRWCKRKLLTSVVYSKVLSPYAAPVWASTLDRQRVARSLLTAQRYERWQERWQKETTGRWTQMLIPNIGECLDRKLEEVGFYVAQVLSGDGCFNSYLNSFK